MYDIEKSTGIIITKKETPVVNFKWFKEVLLSQDIRRAADLNSDRVIKFLDGADLND